MHSCIFFAPMLAARNLAYTLKPISIWVEADDSRIGRMSPVESTKAGIVSGRTAASRSNPAE